MLPFSITLFRFQQAMRRQPKLRKKTVGGSTYRFTSAGATPTYFGNVLETSFKETRKQFAEYLASLANGPKPGNGVTVAGLVEIFLDWIVKSRSTDTYEARRSHLNKFGNLKIGGSLSSIYPPTGCGVPIWKHFLSC